MLKKLLVATAIGLVAVNAHEDTTKVDTPLTSTEPALTTPISDLPNGVPVQTVPEPVVDATKPVIDSDAEKPKAEQDTAATDAAKDNADPEQKTKDHAESDKTKDNADSEHKPEEKVESEQKTEETGTENLGFGRQFGIWEMTTAGVVVVVGAIAAIFGVKKCKRSPPPSSRYGTNLRQSPV